MATSFTLCNSSTQTVKSDFSPAGEWPDVTLAIGNPNGAAALCIAEGFATGATIHEATELPGRRGFQCRES